EDARRNEIFWNEILAPDEIDRLLAPKVLTNFKRYGANPKTSEVSETSEVWSENDNLIIKGNNLLALHSLKKRFGGKVKLIYIDPPYNTGTDSFGYNDSFNHSSWLTFMKNRLEVAKELLRNDGSIWINIGDDEAHYLKVLCDGIFKRENFVRNVLWQKRTSPDTRATLGDGHDHILVYAKNIELFKQSANRLPKTEKQRANFKNPDNDPRGPWVSSDFTAQGYRPNQMYKIITPGGKEYLPPEGRCWKNIESVYLELVAEGRMWFGSNGRGVPRRKTYLYEIEDNSIWSWWTNSEVGHNQEAKKESIALFGADNPFPTPKPERLVSRITQIGSNEDDLILDFFGGSGTSGAVAHKLKRHFILVEQMDYVETHTAERLRKVIGKKVQKSGKTFDEIDFDQGGISKSVNWQGGGSFVYCELLEWNEVYSKGIKKAKDKKELQKIWKDMQERAFLSYRLDVKQFNANAAEFGELSLEEQKRFLLEALDKNHLYVNLSEMDDETYGVSEEDKRLNRLFYGL
ncbi:MAG: site-specific DNA-methyltransferase, partial [Anaerolineales bacterium]|nr:site-specific DNA-methyltransferase [Anaerolineales bacterium]